MLIPKFLIMEMLDNDTDLKNQDYAPAASDGATPQENSQPATDVAEVVAAEVVETVATVETTETAETEDAAVEAPVEDAADEAQAELPASKTELLQCMEATLAADEEFAAERLNRFKQQYYLLHSLELRRELDAFVAAGNEAEAFTPAPDATEEQFRTLMAALKEKKAELRMRLEARQQANLEQKRAIIAELNAMSADTDNVNRLYPQARELQNQFKAIGEVPQQYATEIWKSYQEAIEHFYDQWKVNKELRDYDFKKNLSEKQLLLEEARNLAAEADVVMAFKRLQELHDKWREIGPVAKEFREQIWAEFKDASAVVNKSYQAYFEERKKKEQENEAAKTALCEKIESIDLTRLKGYGSWNTATASIIEAQEEWKKLGYASRKANNALFSRFRQACDAFFAAKAAFFAETKEKQQANLEAKTRLCQQAEALMESTKWKETSDKLIQLQKEWRTIGAVPKRQSDAIWNRFLAACDTFFNRKKEATTGVRKAEAANLAAKKEIIAQLTALEADTDTPRAEAIAKLNELRATWQQTGHVPFAEKDRLHNEYREVVGRLFDKYDVKETRARRASFEASIQADSGDRTKINRERDKLMRVYEAKKSELKTYRNNLGFFSAKSKSGDSMLRTLQGNIQRLEADIADLEQKIKFIDSQL